jgi:hypothetical protein
MVMLPVMAETRADRALGSAMANINSKTQRAKRFAKRRPGLTRLARNVSGSTSMTLHRFWSSWAGWRPWTKLEQGRVAEIRAEGERRRHEHRQEGAAAVSRMVDRGESLTAITELTGVRVSEVRAVLKSAGAQLVASPDAVGAVGAAPDATETAGHSGEVGARFNAPTSSALGISRRDFQLDLG